MAIVYDTAALDRYMHHAVQASPEHPILIDKFLEDATEIDVDALADASGAVDHRRHHGAHRAGRHPLGRQLVRDPAVQAERQPRRDDSRLHAPHRPRAQRRRPDERAVRHQGRRGLRPRGQSARVTHRAVPLEGDGNPARQSGGQADDRQDAGRAGPDERSRGLRLLRQDAGLPVRAVPGRGHAPRPGDEIDGRGHGRRRVVRVGVREGLHGRRAAPAAGRARPSSASTIRTRPHVLPIAQQLADLGFKLIATRGTAAYLRAHGLDVEIIFKVNEGRPHVGDELLNRRISLVINTPLGRESFFDDRAVRSVAMQQGVPAITTLTGAAAAVSAIGAIRTEGLAVKSLQEYHQEMTKA